VCRALPVAVAAVLALAPGRTSGQQAASPEVGWLQFFNPAWIEWLENENQLESLCGKFQKDTGDWRACRKEKLTAQVHVVRLWRGPSEREGPAGSVRFNVTPGKGLSVAYVPPSGGAGTAFTPDLFDSDWGYGPYFHMTVLERRGTWFRLPEDPLPPGTWINEADFGGVPETRGLESGDILRGAFGDLYVIGIEKDVLRARPEQDADMWCASGEPPPIRPWKELRIPLRDLYSPTGHLRVHVKYTRGC
jgi:hypothetical protein